MKTRKCCPVSPDTKLVRQAQGGDRKALGVLFERHRDLVFYTGLRITGNRADAEDVVQETFLSALRFIRAFRSGSKVSTWFYRIAINHSLMIIRRIEAASRRELFSLDEPAFNEEQDRRRSDLVPGGWQSPEEIAAAAETIRLIRREFAFMSPKLRRTFILHAVNNLSQGEVAAIENCPRGTVKARFWRAREELRAALPELAYRR